MPTLTDWLARTYFTREDDLATHDQVKAAQAAQIDAQYRAGKVSVVDYLKNKRLLADTGTAGFDHDLGKPGVPGFLAALPWYAWLLLAVALLGGFLYLGGGRYLKGILNK